jgi:prophage regulatory protein
MKSNSQITPDALLRLPEVESLVGLKRSSIYRAVKAGSFPAPVKLGARASGFPASQIQKWISDRISGGQRKAQ